MITEPARRRRFESVVDDVYDPLQRYLRRRVAPEDAHDLLSETLLTIWRRIDDVPESNPLPWSYGVARRMVANHRRSLGRQSRLLTKLQGERAPVTADPAEDFGDPVVSIALAKLPDPDREVLRLWAWEQLEPREIAQVLDTTPNAVSLRLTRAKKKLAGEIERQNRPSAGHEPDRHAEEQPR